jgi:hypothetical protein
MALQNHILQLAADPDLCDCMGARARVAFERQWDKCYAVAKWEKVLGAVGLDAHGARTRIIKSTKRK